MAIRVLPVAVVCAVAASVTLLTLNSSLAQKIKQASKDANDINDDLAILDGRVSKVEKQAAQLTQEIEKIQKEIAKNSSTEAAIKRRVSQLTSDVVALGKDIESLQENIASAIAAADAYVDKMQKLQTRAASAKNELNNVATNIENLESRYRTLSSEVGTALNRINAAGDYLDSLPMAEFTSQKDSIVSRVASAATQSGVNTANIGLLSTDILTNKSDTSSLTTQAGINETNANQLISDAITAKTASDINTTQLSSHESRISDLEGN